jgi:hypothetical protein
MHASEQMKKLAVILLLLVLLPLLVPLVALGIVIALGWALCVWLWLVWFCWTNADRVFLICSSRRDWEPFLKNNVIPALPDHVSAVWLEAPQQCVNVVRAVRASQVRQSIPFMILVTPFGIKSTPLNGPLQHLKHLGKQSSEVGSDARAIIDAALDDFLQWERRGILRAGVRTPENPQPG